MANGPSSFPSTSVEIDRGAEMTHGPFFEESPFALTADRRSASCWAGRASVLRNLQRLCKVFDSRSDSSLDMIWANLGAGKSHALLHLEYLLASSGGASKALPVFTEMPQQARHFIDLYRALMNVISFKRLAKEILASNDPQLPWELRNAAHVLTHGGGPEKEYARQWIAAGHTPLRELRAVTGIGRRIEDDETASEMLSSIVRALAQRNIRFVLLLDEFQRVSEFQPRGQQAVLSYLRTLFSKNSANFSVVIAAESRIEKNALELLPRELRTLMGMRPAVSLPEMDAQEAFDFVVERFRFYRPSGYSGPALAPLGEPAVREVIGFVGSANKARMIPRDLLQALAWVYDSELSPGTDAVRPDRAVACLKELTWESSG